MPLDFGEHDDVVFERAPLSLVLCQIRFSPILQLLTPAGVAGFQTGLRADYPNFLGPTRNAHVRMGPEEIDVKASPPVWKLADASHSWIVGVAQDFVSLETSKYTDMGEFLERLGTVVKVTKATLRPSDSVRIGMRKVNEINLPIAGHPESLVGVVKREMLGPLAVPGFPVSGAAGQLELVDDDSQLVIRHGLAVRQDAKPERYILDCDFFTERPYRIDRNEVLQLVGQFSRGITDFFHWAIEPGYKDGLGPRKRATRP